MACSIGFIFEPLSPVLRRDIGMGPANVLALLISKRAFWASKRRLQSDGSFYKPMKEIAEYMGVTRKTVIKWIKKLQSLGMVTVYAAHRTYRWCVSHFLINDKVLDDYLTSTRSNPKSVSDNDSGDLMTTMYPEYTQPRSQEENTNTKEEYIVPLAGASGDGTKGLQNSFNLPSRGKVNQASSQRQAFDNACTIAEEKDEDKDENKSEDEGKEDAKTQPMLGSPKETPHPPLPPPLPLFDSLCHSARRTGKIVLSACSGVWSALGIGKYCSDAVEGDFEAKGKEENMGRFSEQERAEKRAKALGRISSAMDDDSRVANAQRVAVEVGKQRISQRAHAKAVKSSTGFESMVADALSGGDVKADLRPRDYHSIYLALLRQAKMDVLTDKASVAELSSWKGLAVWLEESEIDIVTYLKAVIPNWEMLRRENFIAKNCRIPSVFVLCKVDLVREFWNILIEKGVVGEKKSKSNALQELFE